MLPGSILGMVPGGQRSAGAAVVPHAHASSALLVPFALRCAHKGPELGNIVRTQGRNQAVVCGVVLRNSVPCVRNRELCAKGGAQHHQVGGKLLQIG